MSHAADHSDKRPDVGYFSSEISPQHARLAEAIEIWAAARPLPIPEEHHRALASALSGQIERFRDVAARDVEGLDAPGVIDPRWR